MIRLDATVKQGDLVFNVKDPAYGATGDGITNDKAALQAAFAAATAVRGQVFFPPGTYLVDGSLPLSGYSCSIIGSGASSLQTGPGTLVGTVIKAVNQTGPVLDFTGFVRPHDYMSRLRIEGFTVSGDGTAGTAKKGILFPSTMIGLAIRDVSVTLTGGVGFEANDMYLCLVENLVVRTPVNCVTNDVPYIHLRGCNGNTFISCGLRSPVTDGSADVPASGALRMEESAQPAAYQSHLTTFYNFWYENMHVPSNNAIVVCRTNETVFSDPMPFDSVRVAGATNTAHMRFEVPVGGGDTGGNTVRGVIYGRGTDTATTIDYGIVMQQDNNLVEGVKGYRGYNVRIDAGITGTSVILGGTIAGASWPAWENNSGNTANTLIDTCSGVIEFGAISGNATITQGGAVRRVGTGSPEGAVVGNIGDQYIRTDGVTGATVYTKELFNGLNQGWHAHQVEHLTSATLSATQAIPYSSATTFLYTLTANQTFTSVSNPRTGGRLTVMLKQDATGSRTVTWPSNIKWTANTAPTLSTAAGAVDVFVFMFDGTNWREMSRSLGQT